MGRLILLLLALSAAGCTKVALLDLPAKTVVTTQPMGLDTVYDAKKGIAVSYIHKTTTTGILRPLPERDWYVSVVLPHPLPHDLKLEARMSVGFMRDYDIRTEVFFPAGQTTAVVNTDLCFWAEYPTVRSIDLFDTTGLSFEETYDMDLDCILRLRSGKNTHTTNTKDHEKEKKEKARD